MKINKILSTLVFPAGFGGQNASATRPIKITQVLEEGRLRRPIVLMPTEQEFTTVEAPNFLNVSRPFVIKEMEAGRLPHRKVGSHRRIALGDLLAYAQKMRAQQANALELGGLPTTAEQRRLAAELI